MLWGAGVRPSPLAAALGVPLDGAGRVIVGPDCAVPGHPELFVVGDMAAFTPEGASAPLPGISPVAIQEGARGRAQHPAASSRACRGMPFRYFDKGFMATIGRARAVAQLGRLRMSGLIAWLAWVFVHLWYLVGFRNRLVGVHELDLGLRHLAPRRARHHRPAPARAVTVAVRADHRQPAGTQLGDPGAIGA